MSEKTEHKFTVDDLAKKLGVQPASARIALRKAGIEKDGKSYGWDSQKDLEAAVKKIKAWGDKPVAEKKPAAKKPAAKKEKAAAE